MTRRSGNCSASVFFNEIEQDGRVRVSAQIPGTDIRECPATDYVWQNELPNQGYQVYAIYLAKLEGAATRIASPRKSGHR